MVSAPVLHIASEPGSREVDMSGLKSTPEEHPDGRDLEYGRVPGCRSGLGRGLGPDLDDRPTELSVDCGSLLRFDLTTDNGPRASNYADTARFSISTSPTT